MLVARSCVPVPAHVFHAGSAGGAVPLFVQLRVSVVSRSASYP
jgi:hypothetical protein